MVNKIKIYYNEPGIRNIMKGPEISNIEQQIMMQKLNQVQAEFLQRFGFEGKFGIRKVETRSRRSRMAFRIVALDAKTTAALKRETGWLAKFL